MTRFLLWDLYFASGPTDLKNSKTFDISQKLTVDTFNLIDDIINKNSEDQGDRNDYQGFHSDLKICKIKILVLNCDIKSSPSVSSLFILVSKQYSWKTSPSSLRASPQTMYFPGNFEN